MTSTQILKPFAVTAAAIACAAAIWFAGASAAVAPEPARINSGYSLSGANSWTHAVYTESNARTYGYQLSKSWTENWYWRSVAVGAPCADYAAPAGTILPGVVVNYGSFSRCSIY